MKTGKQSFLPPKSPFLIVPPSYGDYGAIAPRSREGQRLHHHHQRTSSANIVLEEQPSWLDELLDEPEMPPVRRTNHRRSSSDSFAYFDTAKKLNHILPYAEASLFERPESRMWDSAPAVREPNGSDASVNAKNQGKEECSQAANGFSERKEASPAKQGQSDTDTKRFKQQFAQRSRVRKLQYITELERHVQALQAKGLEVSAELEFLDQQNLILNLENKALKQRVDSLAQEHHIKLLQQEMLEREIARLKLLGHQKLQLQQQPLPLTHGRSNSRDLDLQFANLSLKHKEMNSSRLPVTGRLQI